ncbi:MAG: aspartyl-trna synthetase [Hyphomonadaceae bacterium]|nr:aspartyl-trna synthetase [Hyphomonadaceae bacterium]MBC6413035.1 aspartyl-trna synthetase [Hyphomonadaceae bacterium]
MTKALIICLILAFQAAPTRAQDIQRRVITEDVPDLADVMRVGAYKTHSGFPVPRHVSLKYTRVNGRLGPSLEHPVLWQYRRKGLPLIVVAEMDVWRKVRDHDGGESWMLSQALSGIDTGLLLQEARLYKSDDPGSYVLAHLEKNVIVRIQACHGDSWCKVRSPTGQKGWVRRDRLWGAQDFDRNF